jgi:GntR family transcriptional regulator
MTARRASAFVTDVPLYRQVQQQIEALIRERGAMDPPLTDSSLSQRFGVSRITVRRAVDELVDAGMLYRIQGVGTFVRPDKLREKLTLASFLDTWSRGDGRLTVKVSAFERVEARADIAERLAVRPGEPLMYIQRLRYQRETLVAVDDRYVPARFCDAMTRQDVTKSSLVDYLRNREKLKLDRGEMDIEARGATAREARLLGIRADKPILVRTVTFFDTAKQPVLTGVSTYRADRVSYRVSVPG